MGFSNTNDKILYLHTVRQFFDTYYGKEIPLHHSVLDNEDNETIFSYNKKFNRVTICNEHSLMNEMIYVRGNNLLIQNAYDWEKFLHVFKDSPYNIMLYDTYKTWAKEIFNPYFCDVMLAKYPKAIDFFNNELQNRNFFPNGFDEQLNYLKQFVYGLMPTHDVYEINSLLDTSYTGFNVTNVIKYSNDETEMKRIAEQYVDNHYDTIYFGLPFYVYLICRENPISQEKQKHYERIALSIKHLILDTFDIKTASVNYDKDVLLERLKPIYANEVGKRLKQEGNNFNTVQEIKQAIEKKKNYFSLPIKTHYKDTNYVKRYSGTSWFIQKNKMYRWKHYSKLFSDFDVIKSITHNRTELCDM